MSIWTDLAGIEYAVRYIDAGGIRTRALQAGTGEAVVFLHGTSGHLEAFVRNIPAHSERYACHAVDMLGHGYTDGADEPYRIPRYVDHVLAYLDACGIERAHFVGESLGGWVAGRLAADHPDRVGRLTLVAPGGTVANPLHALSRIVASLHRPDGTIAVDGFYDGIPALSPQRRAEIAAIGFDEAEFLGALGLGQGVSQARANW